MVDMVAVGHEKRFSVTGTLEHHSDHIETWHQKETERHNRRRAIGLHIGTRHVHAILAYKEADDISQGKAARVAHKDFAASLRIAEHIIGKERYDDANGDERQDDKVPE